MRGGAAVVIASDHRPLTSVQKLRLAAEIGWTYVLVRWWLLRLPFPEAVAATRRRKAWPTHTPAGSRRLGQAVGRLLGFLPFDSRCLIRSLVLSRMLARRGIEASIVIGVQSKPEFAAHAWVERNGIPLLSPGNPDLQRLSEV